ncbi:MAG TPA: AmmeMemoRadiSam system protein B, partial [candidate division WOR-3 bacterium]|nr:AmmeMemoRadiSam system protein B [candidate division WOR-3 bacterium]
KFHRKMETGEVMACGGGGIAILLEALKNFPIKPVEIYYTNSAEVTGIYTGYVVGYASIAFQEV